MAGAIEHYINNFQWIPGVSPLSLPIYPIIASLLYLLLVGTIYSFRKGPEPKLLSTIMMIHNVVLVFLSGLMFFGTLMQIFHLIINENWSLWQLACDPEGGLAQGPLYFWTYLFYVTKYYELIDTFFIVFKGKRPSFLHIYHHVATLNLAFLGMQTSTTSQWFAVLANTFIHMFMYTYYILEKIYHNIWWKKWLTTAQIIQFWLIAMSLLLWLLLHIQNLPSGCSGELYSCMACILVQMSFYLLFHRFYRETYEKRSDFQNVDKTKQT